jgi:hypothetical protein
MKGPCPNMGSGSHTGSGAGSSYQGPGSGPAASYQ